MMGFGEEIPPRLKILQFAVLMDVIFEQREDYDS